MSDQSPDDGVFRLLVMCTANRCRSPMAEAVAADLLEHRGADAAVVSCGTMEPGRAPSPGAVRAMSKRGLDISEHLSNTIDADTVAAADLIVTMERRHITSVGELSVPAIERTFTLRELAELTDVVGVRHSGVTVARWVAQANAMRLPSLVMGMSEAGDIDDPMGGPNRAYRRTAGQIEQLLDRVFRFMFPMD